MKKYTVPFKSLRTTLRYQNIYSITKKWNYINLIRSFEDNKSYFNHFLMKSIDKRIFSGGHYY